MTAKRGGARVDERPPRISVEQSERARRDEQGRWQITWRIHNLERAAMVLRTAQLPHGKFWSEERTFEKGVVVRRGESVTITFPVFCQEAPGSVVDNAFLLLLVDWRQGAWRIFVRFQVLFDKTAEPRTNTELITGHRIGFSAHSP